MTSQMARKRGKENLMSELPHVGPWLRGYREDAGLSLRETAKLCEVQPSFLSSIERGQSRPPLLLLSRLAHVLGLDFIDVVNRADQLGELAGHWSVLPQFRADLIRLMRGSQLQRVEGEEDPPT